MADVTGIFEAHGKARHGELAQRLRDIADDLEAGKISELVVVAHDRSDGTYLTASDFEDRWRLLGALEYAKSKAYNAD